MGEPRKKLNVRAFAALVSCFSAVGLPVTGIGDHVYAAQPMSVARHAWMAAHNVLGLLFVVFSVWHIILNRRALGKHLRGAAGRLPSISREAALAAAIVVLLLLVGVGHAFHGPR